MSKEYKLLSEIKVWKIISCVCFFFLLISVIMVCNLRSYNREVQRTFEHSISENSGILQSLEIVNKNNKEFQIKIDDDTKKTIENGQIIPYKDFMEKYYEAQSNWLNTWLTFLAIVLGLMAIVAPIFFIKFNEKQEEKLGITISKAEEETKKIIDLREKIEKDISTHNANMENKLQKVENDLNEVKKFTNQSKISELLSNANFKIQRKEYNDALRLFDDTLKLDPNNFIAISNRGVCYGFLRKYDKSIADFNKALEIKPNDISNLNNRGMSYNKLEEYTKAVNDFSEVLKHDKKNIIALNGIGFSKIKLKEYKNAIYYFIESIEINPKDKMSMYNLIEAYLFNNQLVNALEIIKKYNMLPKAYIINDDFQIWEGLMEKADGTKQEKDKFREILHNLENKTREDADNE